MLILLEVTLWTVSGFVDGNGGSATDKDLLIDSGGIPYFYAYDGGAHFTSLRLVQYL